jgi:hypothetical protein
MWIILAFLSLAQAEVPCEHLLIDARARFAQAAAVPHAPVEKSEVVAFKAPRQEVPRPAPLRLTVAEFKNRPDLDIALPKVSDYVRTAINLLKAPSLTWKVSLPELKSFFARGVLPSPKTNLAIFAADHLIAPLTDGDKVVLVLDEKASYMEGGGVPIWSLQAIVAKDELAVQAKEILAEVLGNEASEKLVQPLWKVGDGNVRVNRPMIFQIPFNALEILAFARPPKEEEVRAVMGPVDNRVRKATMKKTSFWLPLVLSKVRVSTLFQSQMVVDSHPIFHEGQPIALTEDPYDSEVYLTLCEDNGICYKIQVSMISSVDLVRYVPNGPDGQRRLIAPYEVERSDQLAELWQRPSAPTRLLILTP